MWIPSPMTIAHDVHKVFASCQQQIAAILQVGYKIDTLIRINTQNLPEIPRSS
jgi:hypothetical protein